MEQVEQDINLFVNPRSALPGLPCYRHEAMAARFEIFVDHPEPEYTQLKNWGMNIVIAFKMDIY